MADESATSSYPPALDAGRFFNGGRTELCCWLTSLIILCLVVRLIDPTLITYAPNGMWAGDFLAYKSALHAAQLSSMPYSGPVLLEVQRDITGINLSSPLLIMNNPPWILLLTYPVLFGSFGAAKVCWVIMTVFLVLGAARLGQISFGSNIRPAGMVLEIPFLFFPTIATLAMGQAGGLYAFGVALVVFGARRCNRWIFGLGVALLSIKPHLFLGLFCSLPLLQRRLKIDVLSSSAICFFTLILLTDLLWPGVSARWLKTLLSFDSQMGSTALNMINDSSASLLRLFIFEHTGNITCWPLTVLPAVGSLLCLAWPGCQKPSRDVSVIIPELVVISLVFAPYAWAYDFVALVVMLGAIAAWKQTCFVGERRGVALFLLLIFIWGWAEIPVLICAVLFGVAWHLLTRNVIAQPR